MSVKIGNEWFPVTVTALSSQDVAVLQLPIDATVEPLQLDQEFAPSRGNAVGVYGFPDNDALGPWQSARVDGPLGDGTWQLGFETSLPDHLRGASGGPVFNDENKVVGIFVSHSPLVPQHAAFTPLVSFIHLIEFSSPAPNSISCTLILSQSGAYKGTKLRSAVDASLNITAKRIGKPAVLQVIEVNKCLSSSQSYSAVVRQLCSADVVIFDLTSYEPGMMLLLGIRSAVRAGVTIASLGSELTVAELGNAPFNIKELNIVSHSDEWLTADTPLYRILARRITDGIGSLATNAGYQDSVCFASVRKLPTAERRAIPAGDGALVLCSYSDSYAPNWRQIRKSLSSHLEQKWPDPPPAVKRALDLNSQSGRLISDTIYSGLRRFDLCVVDWTGWRANVFFELGVRIAIHPLGAHCILEEPSAQEDAQQLALRQLFFPSLYSPHDPDDALKAVVSNHIVLKSAANRAQGNSTYSIASEFADATGDSTAIPIYRELLESAKLLRRDESAGISAVLYPSNAKLVKQTEEAVISRLLAAWDFIRANMVEEITANEVSECFLEICDILAPLIKNRNPDHARQIYLSGQKLRGVK